jgi:UrcA family protein
MKTFTLLLASAACCLTAVPALARDGNAPLTVTGPRADAPDTIRVSYRDLNLTSATDVSVLRARVKQATRRVCGELYGGAFLNQEWACRDIAQNIAEPQIVAAIKRAGTAQDLAGGAVQLRFARR